jgi:hypothetical protein
MATKDLLRDEIDRRIEELDGMEVGTDEYKVAVDSLTKLLDRFNEMDKADSQWGALDKEDERQKAELELKREQLELEKKVHEDDEAFKAKQAADERRKMIVNIVMTSLGIIIPTGVTIWGTYKTFKFEETGTITTMPGRLFITKLFSKK